MILAYVDFEGLFSFRDEAVYTVSLNVVNEWAVSVIALACYTHRDHSFRGGPVHRGRDPC
jgi:hypothetical protein